MTGFLLACVTTTQMSAPVTLRVGICNLEQALPELSRKSGVRLKATGQAATEVVFLDLKALPLEKAMKSLASVTGAEWVTGADGSFTLERTPKRIAEVEAAELKERVETLKKWVDFQMNPLATKPESEPLRETNIVRSEPRKAVAMFLSAIGLEKVAQLESRTTHTFVENPNHVQLRLPCDAKAILHTVHADSKLRFASISQSEVVKLEVDRNRDHFEFRVSAVNVGARKARAITSFAVDLPRQSAPTFSLMYEPLTADEQAITALEGNDRKALPQIERYYSDPVRHDPIRLVAQRKLERAAAGQHSLVANCSDDLTFSSGFATSGNALTTPRPPMVGKVLDGVLEWRPSSLIHHWQTRVDRLRLGALIRKMRFDQGGFDALAFARLAEDMDESGGDSTPIRLLWWLGLPDTNQLHADREFRRLALSLTPDQVEKLARYESIPYAELSSRQQAKFRTAWVEASRKKEFELATFDFDEKLLATAKLRGREGERSSYLIFKAGSDHAWSEFFHEDQDVGGITGVSIGSVSGGGWGDSKPVPDEVAEKWDVECIQQGYFQLKCDLDGSIENSMEGGIWEPYRRLVGDRHSMTRYDQRVRLFMMSKVDRSYKPPLPESERGSYLFQNPQ